MQQRLTDEGHLNYRYRSDDNPATMKGIEPTSTALSMAIVTLMSAAPDSETFEQTNLGGILCFVIDRKLRARFFRLYDINTNHLVFQSEVYPNLDYRQLRPKFYCFSIAKALIGFNFANLLDAICFNNLVK